jgi:lysine 2,3-aminomutase
MGEHDTSPVDLITRRYPLIAILKPFNTCSQICVYCQRNWEIDECMAHDAMAPEAQIARAIHWLQHHPSVNEVLVTGGDPMVMPTRAIQHLLDRLASLEQIRRIRIGTRTPVVLPQRWTEGLVDLIAGYQEPGAREICIVTHFEHPYEVTPEAMDAVRRIRLRGMSVYNQQVFSIYNSRRFESAKLRLVLRAIGVDPYYTFNMKGKEETEAYITPIARLLQERKEEARLLPGLDRTDEPVFNVPRLGKNHLRKWQDHRLLSIRPDGRRVYSFHPWEKNITLTPPYYFVDVSIFDYLQRLAARGEDLHEYRTIWYYV